VATLAEALALALEHHRAGNYAQAERIYRQILAANPRQADVHFNLGNILQAQGRLDDAVASYRLAVLLQPEFPAAFNNLGNALRQLGRLGEAASCYREALRLRPDHPETYSNLGACLTEQGLLDEAVACYREALRLRPDYPEAANNLGGALRAQRRIEEAADSYRQALRLRPELAEAHCNLGIVLAEQKKLDEAEACQREALRLRPDYRDAHYNLGTVLASKGRHDEAIASYRQALALRPDEPDAYQAMGVSFTDLGQLAEAETCYRQALRVRPDNPEVHFNLGQLWLLQGRLEQGWPEYEWRWRTKGFATGGFAQPRWDGSDLMGRTILLHAEQGLGDTIQFVRYARLVKQRGSRVVLHSPAALMTVLAHTPGIDQLVLKGTPLPPFDVYASLLSLPGLFGTTLDSVPADVPYIFAEEARREGWRAELAHLPSGLRVGIVWQGNPRHRDDRNRSLSLRSFEPLSRLTGVRLVSLQAGPGAEQAIEVKDAWSLWDAGSQFDASSLADAAALMSHLDLVVTVDTAIAHLAGALAVPVYVLLPFAPDWRWLLERQDSPWYPTVRLFRQQRIGAWREVIERVAQELAGQPQKGTKA
jgi:tetratricopeptide (TPR) repeat protein